MSLYGRKRDKTKCLCKAHVWWNHDNRPLNFRPETSYKACTVKQLHQIVLKELQGYINDVVSMEFCSSVCLSCLLSFFLFSFFSNAEHCWCHKPQTGATVTVCNKRHHLINDFMFLLVSFAKRPTACIPCSDNTFKSAWQNWNKLEE